MGLCLPAVMLLAACGSASRAVQPAGADDAAPLTEAQVLDLQADIYDAMARLNRAQAKGDTEAVEKALDEAMNGIRVLAQQPNALDRTDARELYRSVVSAYETYYGPVDTLQTQYGEIFAFRDAMFEAMNNLDRPLLEDTLLPDDLPAMAGTIPLPTNQLVEQSIQYLLRSPEKHLYRWMSRSKTYFPMIEQIFREEGVPDELKYLALIESGLNPNARSHAAAVGMWQFIAATGKAYGLQVNHWVDERQDPEKATRAAAQHLRDLYKQYGGDWHVAMAGYNCSPRCIRRAEQRARADKPDGPITYWDMYPYLPSETRNYVPMYIAATLLVSNPQAFDLPDIEPGPEYAYDVAHVEGMLTLRQAAEMAGTNLEMIRALNPELRQHATPPSSRPYALRLPVGTHDRFAEAYAALPPEERQGPATYVVRPGDTLGKIARQHGTTVTALREMNGIQGSLIRTDQNLLIPVTYGSYAQAAAPSDVQQVSYDRQEASSSSLPTLTAATTTSSDNAGSRIRYQVRRGDSLTKIANRYGVSISDLRRWNDLRSDRILSGKHLTIYTGGSGPSDSSVRTASHSSSSSSSASSTTHRVQRGENLTQIATRYGVRVTDLRRWNNLRSDRILVGQRLTIQGAQTGSSSAAKRWVNYTVRRGDTLTTIAQRHEATLSEVRKWNDLRSDRIQVGQRLALYTSR